MNGVQFRAVQQVRVESAGQRLVSGQLVPFDVDTRITDELTERFTRSAFAHQYRAANRIELRERHSNGPHSHVLGQGRTIVDRDSGLWGEFRVARTDRGDEWLALASDPEFNVEWSIGFVPLRYREDGPVTVYTRADLFELAFIPAGAYGQAARVSAVREGSPARLLDSLPPLPRLRPLP